MTSGLHFAHGSLRHRGGPVEVTPALAGWTYCGLRIIDLEPGGQQTLYTGTHEVAVLPLSGSLDVECERKRFSLRGRQDVFAAVTDFAYIPIETEVRLSSARGGRFAVPSAATTRRLDPAYGPADRVPVERRGTGPATRQVNNFLAPDAFPADRLIAVEVLTPAGNWSSYPPHKHDQDRQGEAVLEEIYYFEMARGASGVGGPPRHIGAGTAFHRVYEADGSSDLTAAVGHGDVVLVPHGYHGPTVAAPGYDLYYLNVLAGPGPLRTLNCTDDPAHTWVRRAWAQDAPDPRVPMARVPEEAPS